MEYKNKKINNKQTSIFLNYTIVFLLLLLVFISHPHDLYAQVKVDCNATPSNPLCASDSPASQCPNPSFSGYLCEKSRVNCNDVPSDPYSNPNAASCTGHYSEQLLPNMVPAANGTYVNCDVNPNDPACVGYIRTQQSNPITNIPATANNPSALSNTNNVVQALGNTGKTYTLLAPMPCLTGNEGGCKGGKAGTIETMDLNGFFQYAFNLLIGLAGVSAVFMMVWGGFLYMTADAWTQKSEGKEKFTNAIKGLLMVLAAFLILRTVNPKLVAIPKEIDEIKLENGLTRDAPVSIFDKLSTESAKYRADQASVRASIAQGEQQITGIDNQIQDIEKQILSYSNLFGDPFAMNVDDVCGQLPAVNPTIDSLCVDRAQKIASKNVVIADVTVQTVKGISTALVNRSSPTGDPADFDLNSAEIDSVLDDFSDSLPPDQKKQAINYAEYSKALIELNRQQALVYQSAQLSETEWRINNIAGFVSMPRVDKLREASYIAINKVVEDYKKINPHDEQGLLLQLMKQKEVARETIFNTALHP